MLKNGLKILFLGMSLCMTYLAIATSIKSDMFHLSPIVLNEPWFQVTLIDFYFNIVIISAWMIYKEAQWLKVVLWLVAFICLGSIATSGYVFLQILKWNNNEGVEAILLRRR